MKKLLLAGLLVASVSSFGKVLVTSFGQSADAAMLNVLFKKAKLEYDFKPLATAADIAGYDAVAIAAGASSKGMGAAGINPLDELKRSEALVEALEAAGTPIVTFHLGGSGRRGKLSDDYIKVAAEASDKIVVVKGGNEDGFLTNIANANGAEVVEAKNIAGALPAIKASF